MSKGMRYGVAALCVAALAGLIVFFVSGDNSPAANGVFSLAMLVVLVAGVTGLVLVIAAMLRTPR